jgi:tyrosinase
MIYFYPGDVPRDPLNFVIPSPSATSSDVCSNATFASKVADFPQCESQRDVNHLVMGATSLTRVLLGDGINVNDVEAVQAELKDRLHWRVQNANGAEVPLESIPSLMVAVTSTPTTVAKDDGIPDWHHEKSMIYPGVTKGKKGAIAQEEVLACGSTGGRGRGRGGVSCRVGSVCLFVCLIWELKSSASDGFFLSR